MIKMGGSIQQVILDSLSEMEGKCGEEGYIKRGSIQIFNYSCGMIKGPNVIIQVVFGCEVSNPVPDQEFECIVENNTRAGIKARLLARGDSPFIVFLARDHHYMIPQFSDIKENEHIRVKVLGQRFEINDPKISVIATLIVTDEPIETDSTEQPNIPSDSPDQSYKLLPTYKPPIYSPSDPDYEPKNPPTYSPLFYVPPEGGGMDVLVLSDSTKKPGKGQREHVSNVDHYTNLSRHLDWRQQLSPLKDAEFSCDGSPDHGIVFKDCKWKTLEHFRHACIVHLHDPVLALTFCVGGKNGDSAHNLETKYKHLTSHAKWNAIEEDVLLGALTAQFETHPSKMQILKDTAQAQLMCPVQGRLHYYETLRNNK
jgi:hypothetical protein